MTIHTRVFLCATVAWATGLLLLPSAFAVDSVWVGGAAGNWTDAANWSSGVPQAAGDTATINAPIAIAVPSSITIKMLTVNAPATITVASGATLSFSNSGGDVLTASADCLIGGAGNLAFSMNGTSGTDYANLKPAAGTTLTLAARIGASGSSGIELNSAGTLLLTNPGNTFTGATRISAANGTLAFSDPAALGSNAVRLDTSPCKCAYTGTGPATLALPVQVSAASATFENAGSGTLTLSGNVSAASAGAKTLIFAATSQTILVSGALSNGSGALTVTAGAGTLAVSGTTLDCALAVSGGGTLSVVSGALFQNLSLTCSAGAALAFNPALADGFAVTLPLTNSLSGAGVRLLLPAAATASSVTLPTLLRTNFGGSLDIVTSDIGTPRNALFIQNFSPGALPAWITVNGQPAAYDATLGVIAASASGATHSLAALGPSVIPDDPTSAAIINAAGTSGGITLAADPTRLFSLTQSHADNPATVELGGQTLAASVVAVAAEGNSLTLTNGTLSTASAQTPPGGAPSFPALATPPIAWFDLSDAATVTTNAAGRITLLANKGSRGSVLDAVVPADRIGPRYVPGAVNGLGVARSDGIVPPQGLATLGNAGITGSVGRTTFLVAARSPVSQNTFYALYLGSDSGNNQDFSICERASQTSFSTKGNDLDIAPASPVGHNVLTFLSGLNDAPNAGAGFRNGALLGTKTFAFATADAPIRLLHRPVTAANFSGPGEVAEALVFNYTLSDTDRAAVESYLRHKWRIAAVREDALLALRNDSPAARLTVSASLAEAYGTQLSLAKSGPGEVALVGPAAFSGALLLNEGALTFDTPAGGATVLAAPVSGPGSLLKRGAGGLALSLPSAYSGGTTVRGGTLYPGANGSLGTGPITVESGAALDIANGSASANPATGTSAFANPVAVEGAGPDGLGALRHSGGVSQQNAFKTVVLTGDAAVFSASRFDVRGGLFDFGGRALTLHGGGEFSIAQCAVSNVTPATAVHVSNGMMRFEQSDFAGSSANTVDAASGSGVCLYQLLAPLQWSLLLADNAYFRANNGNMDSSLNVWAGPVTLDAGTVRLNILPGGTASFTGAVGGNGGLLKEGEGWFWLLNPANTYAGATTVTQGNLYAVSPGSLGAQAAGGLAVTGTGSFVARATSVAAPDGWSNEQLAAIANATVFASSATSLGIDTRDADFAFAGPFPYIGLKKLGPHTLALSGSAPDLGAIEIYDGELDLSDTGTHNLHTYSAFVGAAPDAAPLARLRLAAASLDTDDPGYSRAGPSLTVGAAASARGILYVEAGAAANGRLLVGNSSGSAGAVFQTSGTVTNTGGTANEAAIGVSGYGYYRLEDGTFASKGSTQLGRNSSGTGILEQRGGNLLINPGSAPAAGVVGDYYNGTFAARAGVGILHLAGGTFSTSAHSLQLGEWSAENTYSNGLAVFTVESGAQATVDNEIRLANRNGSPEAYVNLNGGTLSATFFQKGGNNAAGNTAKAAIAFNGGLLRVPAQGNALSSLVRTGTNNSPALLNVFADGAVIETLGTDGGITLDLPLRAPAGFGVTGVSVTSAGAGYLAPPAVTFSGGNGTGATAVAEIDLGSGALTAIRVTSPGVGYTAAPAVTLRGGGATTAATASAAIGAMSSGGLTKLGPGTLTLAAPCTYTGPTVVSNGTLRLAAGAQTLTPNTAITLAGGTLDLAGAALTNLQPVWLEGGRLVNGTVSALSFTKAGAGAATLAASAVAPAPAALREAFIKSLGPIIWYDPSDNAPGNLVVDGSSRVSLLRNKGSLGAAHDAVPVSGTGPLLLSGAASPSPLGAGVLQIDSATAVMKSGADVPVTGTSPRTLIAVLARDSTRAVAGIGSGAEGQTFEIGNDPTKTYVSGIGASRDTQFTTAIPGVNQLIVIAAANGYGGNFARGIQLWRSAGPTLETLTATWPADLGTAAAPFSIGRRGATTYRGKVGDVLLFDRILSAGEISALHAVLAAKYLSAPAGENASAAPPVTIAEGTLRLAPSAEAVAALAPAVWYDPSDAASVTTNAAGRVTAIANKGSSGSALDAGLKAGFQGPVLVGGADTYSAAGKPMLKIDGNTTGLQSASNTGVGGTAPRTLIAVLARDLAGTTDQQATVAFGNQDTPRAMFELTDRYGGNCFGNNGDDLFIAPVLPAANASVYMMEATADTVLTGWRSGGAPSKVSKTLAGSWATVNTPLCLGYRPNTHRDTFRGQIGEVLLFDRLLSESERADIEDYLVNKWTRRGADSPFSGMTFNVAAGATLDLGGSRTNVTVAGSGTVANGTLGADFVISPAGDQAVGELTFHNVTVGPGSLYRLTISGAACDRLLISGDLSGLTVVPATGAELTGSSYLIATGNFVGKPALSGFPVKYKLLRQGSDLLLSSVGGAMLLLR